MQIRVVADRPWEIATDVLVVPVSAPVALDGIVADLDRRSGGEMGRLAAFGELTGKALTTALGAAGELPAQRILAVGLGEPAKVDREAIRRAGGAAIRRLGGRVVRRVAVWAGDAPSSVGQGAFVEHFVRGLVEGSFEPGTIYRETVEGAPPLVEELVLAVGTGDSAALLKAAERGRIVGEGANTVRRLANRAANDVSPVVLAEEASALAAAHGLSIEVIEPERAAELGMGLFLAVGRGSSNPPRMIVMRSGAAGATDRLGRRVALVGKGVCFDSGGISIKPSERMEEMKMDKTGACTVIAAITTVARLAPGTPLLAIAPAVENMPGPHSTRPGDVVRALNGKTVDITNTDAEGRLILADAMTYAERLGATHLVDVATLTGAAARTFGHVVSAAFGTPQDWYERVASAAELAGERLWQMPLVEDYVPDMESPYADLNNAGPVEGGLIKSALFLREFVTRPWVHLDIAGTAYFRKALPWAARGASGAAPATLVELALEGAA